MSIISLFFAASLSLSSLSDYIYVQTPTNGTVDIRGLGTGSEGLYSMPRREDWFFLSEAVSERESVCTYLLNHPSETITLTTNNVKGTGLDAAYYASVPSMTEQKETFGLYMRNLYSTNTAMIVKDENFMSGAIYDDASVVQTNMMKMMFTDKKYHTSTTYESMSRYYTDWLFFGPSVLAFGMITNAYFDICANTCPLFKQRGRCPYGTYTRRRRQIYSKPEMISGWSASQHKWLKSPLTDSDDTYTNTGSGSPDPNLIITSERRTLTRNALNGVEDGSIVAQIKDDYSRWFFSERNFKGRMIFPNFKQGTVINGIKHAYVVVDFTRNITSGTNVFKNVHKQIIGTATLTNVGETDDGNPIYEHNLTLSELHEQCAILLEEELSSEEELKALLPSPDYPALPKSQEYATITDQIITKIEYYIGAANVLFHARVL